MKNYGKKIEGNEAIELLKDGYSLFEPKVNPSKLTHIEGDKYRWNAINDIAPTVLNEAEVIDLVKDNKWVITLI